MIGKEAEALLPEIRNAYHLVGAAGFKLFSFYTYTLSNRQIGRRTCAIPFHCKVQAPTGFTYWAG